MQVQKEHLFESIASIRQEQQNKNQAVLYSETRTLKHRESPADEDGKSKANK